jgi:AraC family transcriptional activator of mtrCDE
MHSPEKIFMSRDQLEDSTPAEEKGTPSRGLLDQLLALVDVDGRLDVRCELGPSWKLKKEAQESPDIPFHVLLEGEAIVHAQGLQAVTMKAGDVLILPGGGAHSLLSPLRAEGARAGAFEWADGTLLCGRFIVGGSATHLVSAWLPQALLVRTQTAPPATRLALEHLLELMRLETQSRTDGSATVLRHLSSALFAVALRLALQTEALLRGALGLISQPRLAKLASAILAAPGKDWTLETMADHVHLSRSSLIRAVRSTAGSSPSGLLAQIRMSEACRMLRAGDLSVAAVGGGVGYASDAAFQRAFKRTIGHTPAEWRASATAGHATPSLHGPHFIRLSA